MIIMDLTWYKIEYTGNMYEVINKVTGATEVYDSNLPHALGNAKAFNAILDRAVQDKELTESFINLNR